jgi:hypothetical protein
MPSGGSGGGAPGDTLGCQLDHERIFDDVAYLASAEMRGREVGDVGNALAVDFAEEQFQQAGLLPGGVGETYRQSFEFDSGKWADNVLGLIVGSDPSLGNEVIIVGAHIDHLGIQDEGIFYGADDNASGAAIIMEFARMFDRCDITAKRSVLFVEWNAEEEGEGMLGSTYYTENPTFPLEDIVAVYNLDMVGVGDGSGVTLFQADDQNNVFLTELMEKAAAQAGLSYVIERVPSEWRAFSDQKPFGDRGIPFCFGSSRDAELANGMPQANWHTPLDTTDRINPESLKASAELFWAALRPLALGEEGNF